jgi:hypothetical protein
MRAGQDRTRRVLIKTKNYEPPRTMQIVAIIICALLFVGFLSVLFVVVFRPCSKDQHCTKENICTIDYCQGGFCKHDWKDGCCHEPIDCDTTICHNSLCHNGQCRVIMLTNGTSCTDNSLCTIDDKCITGKCEGNALNCPVNSCADTSCQKDLGCTSVAKPDDTVCSDSDLCTVGDKCYSGICASGLSVDCSHMDTQCEVGVCSVSTGVCMKANRADGTTCNDNAECTVEDQCSSGTCVGGSTNLCYDNNPCTTDACVPSIGCMVQYTYNASSGCVPGCTSSTHCPTGFICHDGTCLSTPATGELELRFIDYEIENCTSEGHRLLMSYSLDAKTVIISSTTYYQIVENVVDFTTATAQPNGFIDVVVTLNSAVMTPAESSRTAFMLATACVAVTESNCGTIFNSKVYEFDVALTNCEQVHPPGNCITTNNHVQAYIPISISECTDFDSVQTLIVVGNASVYFMGNKYTGSNLNNEIDITNNPGERLIISLETSVYANEHLRAFLYYVRICTAKPNHVHAECVYGTKTSGCPVIGCYGWDSFNSFDNPVQDQFDILQNGYITSLGFSLFGILGAYETYVYHGANSVQCQAIQVPNWPYQMDDGLSITTSHFQTPVTLVVDMIYRITPCGVLRSGEQGEQEEHRIGTIKIK